MYWGLTQIIKKTDRTSRQTQAGIGHTHIEQQLKHAQTLMRIQEAAAAAVCCAKQGTGQPVL